MLYIQGKIIIMKINCRFLSKITDKEVAIFSVNQQYYLNKT